MLAQRVVRYTLVIASASGDLPDSEHSATPHIAEALQYRPRIDVG